MFFFFKQKTAYVMRISDWSSDVCSSELNFHLATLVSAAFQRLVSDRPAGQVARLIAEVPLVEWQLDGKLRETAVDLLRRHGIRLCLEDRKSTRLNSSH